jgi:hypothetical protein
LPYPSQDDLIRYYTLNEPDLSLIRQRRGDADRLGFAVQLCLLRYPGYARASDMTVAESVIPWVARQVRIEATAWAKYGERDETRSEHIQELRTYLGLSPFGLSAFRFLVHGLIDLAMQTDKGLVLAAHAQEALRHRQIILPALMVIERACAEAVTRANRRIYRALIERLTEHHRARLGGGDVRAFARQRLLNHPAVAVSGSQRLRVGAASVIPTQPSFSAHSTSCRPA